MASASFELLGVRLENDEPDERERLQAARIPVLIAFKKKYCDVSTSANTQADATAIASSSQSRCLSQSPNDQKLRRRKLSSAH